MNSSQLATVDYDSRRAQKARFAVLFHSQRLRMEVICLLCLLVGGGILLALLNVVAGLVLASFAVWPLMLLTWYKGELRYLEPDSAMDSLDDVLTYDVLGSLPYKATPPQIAKVVMSLEGGQFFAVRFGVPADIFAGLNASPEASQPIWERAEQLRVQFQMPTIDAAMIYAALLEQVPGIDQLLAPAHVDMTDIIKGVGWHAHINYLISENKLHRATGGIGRDWAFGYTPLLQRFALNVSESVSRGGLMQREIEGHQNIVQQMVQVLSDNGRQNIALIGPAGAGKTTLVYALAQQIIEPDSKKIPKNLEFCEVMALDPTTLISHAHGRGELEGLMQQLFEEAIKAHNIILFLDNAELFLEDGTGSINLSNLLVPILESGALRIILAMDEQRWLRLVQINPSLAQFLNRVNVVPPNRDETMLVLEDQLLLIEFQHKVVFMYQALTEAYRLGDRYVQDQAMPSKAIRLLEGAVQFADNGRITAKSVQQAVERSYGIKVGNADEAQERQTLLNLEDLIHQRMINQKRAVSVVASALRRARTGVRNQDKPIGTFLFLGPTGVGKTELAKSLAAVYFGGENRLVRVDLNEFSQPQDVNRLIADGSTAEATNSLTAQIAKQPFSVVLLDEIEKAHPNVLNTLLQLLDEGVLRDINNRPVSFRDAIVIATSNAGAARIRQYIDAGYQLEQFEQPFINELIDSGQFKPEFLNRFDEIVVFRPLEAPELLQVVDLNIASINRNLASQKVSVHLSDDAKQLLVKTGYDPRLGARPMRRVIQRTVEDLVAKRMLAGEIGAGSVVEIAASDIQVDNK